MRYLCLIFPDPAESGRLFDRDWKELEAEHLAYGETLRGSGQLIAAEALQPAEAGTVVRMRNGKLSVTDGPFMETKEQLGGFYLIEARDLNEAIRVASKIPSARLGSIEVRPIRELEQNHQRR
jgi:hypothetical protein